jgi:hypothetical protein
MPLVKLAYVITAHKNPAQLLRLLKAIDQPGNTYVLHVDAKADPDVHGAARDFASSHPNATVIPSETVLWGSWRIAHAQIRCMAEALRVSRDWDYCLNLTGQDYPLRTQAQIAAELSAGPPGANYIEVAPFSTATSGPRKRMEYYWVPWRGQMRKLLPRGKPPFNVFWGSNWITCTRAACEHFVSSDASKRMQRFFRFTLCADEMIFQNAIMHGPRGLRESIVNRNFRRIVWDGGISPRIFTMKDLNDLLNSNSFFARKFDTAIDSRVLDALDEHLRCRPMKLGLTGAA